MRFLAPVVAVWFWLRWDTGVLGILAMEWDIGSWSGRSRLWVEEYLRAVVAKTSRHHVDYNVALKCRAQDRRTQKRRRS